MNRLVVLLVFLVLSSSSCFAGPADVLTAFINPSGPNLEHRAEACKSALRMILTESGIDRQIKNACQNGKFRKRYLLKIAHNNGAGVDGFFVASNAEMPGFVWAVVKTLFEFFGDAAKESLSDDEQKLVRKGEALTRSIQAMAEQSKQGGTRSRHAVGLKLVASVVKSILSILQQLTGTASWNVIGYPAVSNPTIAVAWAELVREWGGEPWIGDESGMESPDTLVNMKASGFYDAATRARAHLWVFNRGVIDLSNPRNGPNFITQIDGQRLDTFTSVSSPYLTDYPQNQIGLPSPIVQGFFAGIFFEAHPKSHAVSTLSGAIKNLVGLMNNASRRDMHNISKGKSPWTLVNTHRTNSNKKIAQTAYAATRILGTEIMGYLGDSISTITAIGPDTGPHTIFHDADQTITFSRNLFWQETATLAVSMIAANHVMATNSKHPRLQFNPYFRGGDPLADEIYRYYRTMALTEGPELSSFSWRFIGTFAPGSMIEDLRGMLKTHLSNLKIELH